MLPIIPIRTWKRRHPILHRSTTPIRAHHGPSEVILFSATRSPKIKNSGRLMYAPRRWALKKRPLFVWGKYFVLRFPSMDCLVYFDPGRGRRERCPEDGLD